MTPNEELAPPDAPPDALRELVDSLLRLARVLDTFGAGGTGGLDDNWLSLVRTLYHAEVIRGLRLIAVAGGQGAGKTTLLRNLYPLAADWLQPNMGRGEQIPVCVIETEGATEARAFVVRRGGDGGPLRVQQAYGRDKLREWNGILVGNDPNVLLAKIEVPPSLLKAARGGFVLLPGFERQDGSWQTLMRAVLGISMAAVVVTDVTRLADGMQRRILADLRDTGMHARPADLVVALSRSDGEDEESLQENTARAAEVFAVQPKEVVPFGPDADDPVGWIGRFVTTVGDIVPSASDARRREAGLLRAAIVKDVQKVLSLARSTFDHKILDEDQASKPLREILAIFDTERNVMLDRLDESLRAAFGGNGRLGEAATELAEKVGNDGHGEMYRRMKDRLRFDPNARDRRLIDLVAECWQPHQARLLQSHVFDELSRRRLGELEATWQHIGRTDQDRTVSGVVLGARNALGFSNPGTDVEATAGAAAIDLTSVTLQDAVRLLPAMALATRGFSLTFADASGRITAFDEMKIEEHVRAFGKDRSAFLGGIALFLGLDIAVDGDIDSPKVIAHALSTLLTGSGGAAAGAAPGAAAGAAGAAAAAPYVALAVVVIAGGLALMAAANRAIAERANVGQGLLREHHDVTVSNAREGVVGLLRVTREILEARLSNDLGIGRQQRNRYALQQAVNEVTKAQTRLLGPEELYRDAV